MVLTIKRVAGFLVILGIQGGVFLGTVALVLFGLSGAAQACTATGVMNVANAQLDNPVFSVVRDVVIEELAIPLDWENEASIVAAVGTIFVENSGPFSNLGTEELVEEFLDVDATRHQGQTYTIDGVPIFVQKVRDHAHVHGAEWEANSDWSGNEIPTWWYEDWNAEPDNHAG